jgi:hypothetical protein
MPPVISTSGGAHGARSPATTPVCETVFDAPPTPRQTRLEHVYDLRRHSVCRPSSASGSHVGKCSAPPSRDRRGVTAPVNRPLAIPGPAGRLP